MKKKYINLDIKESVVLSKKYLLLVITLFFNYFNTGGFRLINLIGVLSYIFTATLIIDILFYKKRVIKYKMLLILWCILSIFIYLIWNSGNNYGRVIITIVQLFTIFLITIIGSGFKIDEYYIRKYSRIHKILIIMLYIMVILRLNKLPFMFKNLNSLSEMTALFCILNIYFYYMSAKKIKIYNALLYLPLLLISEGRNMLLCVMVFISIFFLWKIIVKNKLSRIIMFTTIIAIIYIITIKYPEWYYNSSMVELNHFIRNITGKNFFSGRQEIWKNIIELGNERAWTGYGTGTLYSNLSDSKLSAHNQYLQIYMQCGLIGIGILFSVLALVWMKISKCTNVNIEEYKRKRLSGAFIIAFMICNIFTVSMIQNTIYSSLLGWFMIGIGLGKTRLIGEK